MNLQNIKFRTLGDLSFYSKRIQNLLISAEKLTEFNNKMILNLAINYGSKSEIVEAIKRIIKKKQNISEKKITSNLYTSEMPDPEILIRTGNTKRLSNFLLWQIAYSEIFFEKKLWPDFNEKDYYQIIKKYKSIKRNFGNI